MDIVPGDKDKFAIRVATGWLRRKYKAGNKDQIHEDMQNCGNPVIKKIYKHFTKEAEEKVGQKYHRNTMKEYFELFLWIMERDTAYRDPFFYFLAGLLEMKEEIMPHLKKYLKEPDEWYVNVHQRSKDLTSQKKKDGFLPRYGMSDLETFFVPSTQKKRFKELNKELDEDYKKSKRRRTAW